MDDKVTSRIKFEKRGVDLNNRDDWPATIEHMKHGAIKWNRRSENMFEL